MRGIEIRSLTERWRLSASAVLSSTYNGNLNGLLHVCTSELDGAWHGPKLPFDRMICSTGRHETLQSNQNEYARKKT